MRFLIVLIVLAPALAYGDRHPVRAPLVMNAKGQHSSKDRSSFVTFTCEAPHSLAGGKVMIDCIRIRNYVESKDGVCTLGSTFAEKMQFTHLGGKWVLSEHRPGQCSPTMFIIYPDKRLWNYREIAVDDNCNKTVYDWHWFSPSTPHLVCTSFQ